MGEASEDCLASKRGFPLPTLPRLGGGAEEHSSHVTTGKWFAAQYRTCARRQRHIGADFATQP